LLPPIICSLAIVSSNLSTPILLSLTKRLGSSFSASGLSQTSFEMLKVVAEDVLSI